MCHSAVSRKFFVTALCGLFSGGAAGAEIGAEFTRAFSGEGITRMQLIFQVFGTDTGSFAVFAQGPSLTDEGVPDAMPDPQINLLKDGTSIASNDDWEADRSAPEVARVAEALNVTLDSQDAAMIRTLGAGLYTVVVTDTGGAEGIARVGALNVRDVVGGITSGTWTGGNPDTEDPYYVCLNVSADGTELTEIDSNCTGDDDGIDPNFNAFYIAYEGGTTPDGSTCNSDADFDDDIPIQSDGSFSRTFSNDFVDITVTGQFSGDTVTGTTRVVSAVDCSVNWTASAP